MSIGDKGEEVRILMREANPCLAWCEQGRLSTDEYEACKILHKKLREFMPSNRQFREQSSLFESYGNKGIDLDVGMLNNNMLQSLAEKLKDEGDAVFIRGNPDKSIRVRVFFTPK